MVADTPTRAHRMRRWRIRVLFVILAIALAVYGHSQIYPDRPSSLEETSPEVKRLFADVKALGGSADIMTRYRRTFGFRHGHETVSVSFAGRNALDDESLRRFVHTHGDRLGWLDLRFTAITDDGLRHLAGAHNLHHLVLGNQRPIRQRSSPFSQSPITDAGLIHLKRIPNLSQLSLNSMPITDAGLGTLKQLPRLTVLYLTETEVTGPGLSVLKSMPKLQAVTLEGGAIDDQSLSHLAGATNLQLVQLRFLSMSNNGLTHLKTLPKLRELSLYRCGLLDQDIAAFRRSRPMVKVVTP